MEKMLLKLARQLDSLDEASLMALWSKYATQTSRFEPSKRWEEACLIFSLIQAKRWKNQLFNYSWKQNRMPPLKNSSNEDKMEQPTFDLEEQPHAGDLPAASCRILSFSQSSPHENNEK